MNFLHSPMVAAATMIGLLGGILVLSAEQAIVSVEQYRWFRNVKTTLGLAGVTTVVAFYADVAPRQVRAAEIGSTTIGPSSTVFAVSVVGFLAGSALIMHVVVQAWQDYRDRKALAHKGASPAIYAYALLSMLSVRFLAILAAAMSSTTTHSRIIGQAVVWDGHRQAFLTLGNLIATLTFVMLCAFTIVLAYKLNGIFRSNEVTSD